MRRSELVELGATLREAGICWLNDRCMLHGSALAFGAVFALAPLFVIVVEITNHLVDHRIVEGAFIGQIQHSIGPQAAGALRAMIDASRHNTAAGTLAHPIAWALLIGTACGVFFTVQDSLNIIWHVEGATHPTWHHAARAQTVTMVTAFGLGLVGIAAVTMLAVVVVGLSASPTASPAVQSWTVQVPIALASFVILTPVIAVIFRYLPAVRTAWPDVWSGAALAAALFLFGQWIIAFYLSKARMESSYGAAASYLAMLMWIFISTLVFYYGAEFTRISAKRRGERGAGPGAHRLK